MAIMGYGGYDRRFEVIGEDADTGETVSVKPQTLRRIAKTPQAMVNTSAVRNRMIALPDRAGWRDPELAPGVNMVDEGMFPLALTPLQNAGLFTSVINTITFQGQLQKPFRAERLLATTAVTLALATNPRPRLLGQFYVGTDLQMADIAAVDVEAIGAPTAFGTRMTLSQAPPGVLIRVPVVLSGPLTAGDTIFLSLTFMGRVVH